MAPSVQLALKPEGPGTAREKNPPYLEYSFQRLALESFLHNKLYGIVLVLPQAVLTCIYTCKVQNTKDLH